MKNKIILFLMLVCASMKGSAQDGDITGKIVDSRGNPVSGAQVSIVGNPYIKVVTDKDGLFAISAIQNDELEVRTSENGTKRVLVTKIPMQITIGYASQATDMGFGILQTMEESTASISRATNEQINKRSSLSLANSLYGNALGLTALQNTGAIWESGASLSIRGLQTLSNNGILVLVDGFERAIQNITPEEVESVSVLRDAAAVALYGYKGINGVLSIKTKRGKYKTKDISISYDHAFTSQSRLPKFADAYTYANAVNEALTYDGKSPRYSKNELDAFQSGNYPYLYPNVNWVDEVFRDHGASNMYNIGFQGGGARMRYYTMLNLQDNSGFIKNPDMNEGYSTQMQFSKLNIRTNLDVDLTSSTSIEVGLLGILEEFSRPGLNSDNLIGKLYTVPSAAFPIKTEDGIWGGNETWGATMNPVALTQARGYSKGHNRTMFADIKLNQGLDFITKGLNASVRFGYDNMAAYWEGRNRGYEYASDAAASWVDGEPGDLVRFKGGETSNIGFDSSLDAQNRHFNFVGNVDYQTAFGKSKLFASLIYSYENLVTNRQNNTYFRQNVAGYTHYSLLNRYIADLTLVASASNKLAPGKKWGVAPTLSVAWILSNEPFMQGVSAIDLLKLRASAGIIHTDNIPTEDYWEQSFDGGNGYNLGQNYVWYGGRTEGRLPSLNSTREKAVKYNLGVDAAFFKGFTLSTDIYYERRKDIWVSAGGKNSSVLGVASPYVNAGIVDSKGVEAGLNYERKWNDLLVSLGGKFTLAKNEIIERLEEPQAYEYLRTTGKSINQLFGLQAIGFFVDNAEVANSPIQQFSEAKKGDVKYKDQNGDGMINDYDRVPMGYNTSVPEAYYSFDFGVEWKGFGVSATFQGAGNYSAVLTTQSMFHPLINNTTVSEHYYANRWTPENPFAKYPRLTTESNANNFETSSIWLADASFLKLRNCEIYYKLPSSLLAKAKMKNAKLYVRGVDLLCFDKIEVTDPESVGTAYPVTKSINVGFAIGF